MNTGVALGGGVDDAAFNSGNQAVTPYSNVLLYSDIVAKDTATAVLSTSSYGTDIAGCDDTLDVNASQTISYNLIGAVNSTPGNANPVAPNFPASVPDPTPPHQLMANANGDLVGTADNSIDPMLGTLEYRRRNENNGPGRRQPGNRRGRQRVVGPLQRPAWRAVFAFRRGGNRRRGLRGPGYRAHGRQRHRERRQPATFRSLFHHRDV